MILMPFSRQNLSVDAEFRNHRRCRRRPKLGSFGDEIVLHVHDDHYRFGRIDLIELIRMLLLLMRTVT